MQARGKGWLDDEKWVKEVQLRSSSQRAEHSSELATSKIVSTKFSAVISHCSSSTKQSIEGEDKEMGKRKKRNIIVNESSFKTALLPRPPCSISITQSCG